MIVNYPVRPEDIVAMNEQRAIQNRAAKRQARIRAKERANIRR